MGEKNHKYDLGLILLAQENNKRPQGVPEDILLSDESSFPGQWLFVADLFCSVFLCFWRGRRRGGVLVLFVNLMLSKGLSFSPGKMQTHIFTHNSTGPGISTFIPVLLTDPKTND